VNECHVGSTDGTMNPSGLVPPSAFCMNVRQIVAGKVGPETAIPWTFSIGTSPRGYPIQTVASRFRV
jgi:hypothetical protein